MIISSLHFITVVITGVAHVVVVFLLSVAGIEHALGGHGARGASGIATRITLRYVAEARD